MVLILAVLVLTTLILLAGAVVWSAVQGNTSANQQQFRDAALAAANAGLAAVDYRLTAAATASSGITTTDCFTTTTTAPPSGSPASCAGETESFGSASYTYYATPLSGSAYPTAPADCTGWPVTGTGVAQYCLTSIGTDGGVSRRVQERVAEAPPLFPVAGILSLTGITSPGVMQVNGNVQADGPININHNNSYVHGTITYVPPAMPSLGFTCNSASSCSEATAAAYAAPTDSASPYQLSDPAQGGTNNDAAINWGASGVYNSSTRVINYSGSVGSASNPVQIPAGTYNFCEIDFQNNVYLEITGRPVIIYLDSPYRTGSGCPNNTGDVNITNTFVFENPYADPTALEIFAYGNPTGPQPNFKFTNTVDAAGDPWYVDISAPYSAFSTTNTVSFDGSIVAGSFTNTNTMTMTGAGGGSSAGWHFAPTAWAECAATPSATGDPDSGCY